MNIKNYPDAVPRSRVVSYSIACTPEFVAWLRRLSNETLIPVASLTRSALREWADSRGHEAPPPR